MKLAFEIKLAEGYESKSQIARVLTESWVGEYAFCPNCGKNRIERYAANKPVADFYCSHCLEDYELKSKQKSMGRKIVDGRHDKMIERLNSSNNPNLFLLSYNPESLSVITFLVVPKHFFVPGMIEKRKPLSLNAIRKNWVGCNILLSTIPKTGKIYYVNKGQAIPKKDVLHNWKRTLFLRDEKELSAKGWLLDVMRCVDNLNQKEFTLSEMYGFEKELNDLHPDNRHVRDKIRQQLQVLRDNGYLEFLSRGRYRLV